MAINRLERPLETNEELDVWEPPYEVLSKSLDVAQARYDKNVDDIGVLSDQMLKIDSRPITEDVDFVKNLNTQFEDYVNQQVTKLSGDYGSLNRLDLTRNANRILNENREWLIANAENVETYNAAKLAEQERKAKGLESIFDNDDLYMLPTMYEGKIQTYTGNQVQKLDWAKNKTTYFENVIARLSDTGLYDRNLWGDDFYSFYKTFYKTNRAVIDSILESQVDSYIREHPQEFKYYMYEYMRKNPEGLDPSQLNEQGASKYSRDKILQDFMWRGKAATVDDQWMDEKLIPIAKERITGGVPNGKGDAEDVFGKGAASAVSRDVSVGIPGMGHSTLTDYDKETERLSKEYLPTNANYLAPIEDIQNIKELQYRITEAHPLKSEHVLNMDGVAQYDMSDGAAKGGLQHIDIEDDKQMERTFTFLHKYNDDYKRETGKDLMQDYKVHLETDLLNRKLLPEELGRFVGTGGMVSLFKTTKTPSGDWKIEIDPWFKDKVPQEELDKALDFQNKRAKDLNQYELQMDMIQTAINQRERVKQQAKDAAMFTTDYEENLITRATEMGTKSDRASAVMDVLADIKGYFTPGASIDSYITPEQLIHDRATNEALAKYKLKAVDAYVNAIIKDGRVSNRTYQPVILNNPDAPLVEKNIPSVFEILQQIGYLDSEGNVLVANGIIIGEGKNGERVAGFQLKPSDTYRSPVIDSTTGKSYTLHADFQDFVNTFNKIQNGREFDSGTVAKIKKIYTEPLSNNIPDKNDPKYQQYITQAYKEDLRFQEYERLITEMGPDSFIASTRTYLPKEGADNYHITETIANALYSGLTAKDMPVFRVKPDKGVTEEFFWQEALEKIRKKAEDSGKSLQEVLRDEVTILGMRPDLADGYVLDISFEGEELEIRQPSLFPHAALAIMGVSAQRANWFSQISKSYKENKGLFGEFGHGPTKTEYFVHKVNSPVPNSYKKGWFYTYNQKGEREDHSTVNALMDHHYDVHKVKYQPLIDTHRIIKDFIDNPKDAFSRIEYRDIIRKGGGTYEGVMKSLYEEEQAIIEEIAGKASTQNSNTTSSEIFGKQIDNSSLESNQYIKEGQEKGRRAIKNKNPFNIKGEGYQGQIGQDDNKNEDGKPSPHAMFDNFDSGYNAGVNYIERVYKGVHPRYKKGNETTVKEFRSIYANPESFDKSFATILSEISGMTIDNNTKLKDVPIKYIIEATLRAEDDIMYKALKSM